MQSLVLHGTIKGRSEADEDMHASYKVQGRSQGRRTKKASLEHRNEKRKAKGKDIITSNFCNKKRNEIHLF